MMPLAAPGVDGDMGGSSYAAVACGSGGCLHEGRWFRQHKHEHEHEHEHELCQRHRQHRAPPSPAGQLAAATSAAGIFRAAG